MTDTFALPDLRRDPRDDAPTPAPIWLSLGGLAAAAAFSTLAALALGPLETVALLIGAAVAGGLGLFGLIERALLRSRADAGATPVDAAGIDATIEHAPEPMAVVDRFGRAVALNAAARRGLGLGVAAPSRPFKIETLLAEAPDRADIVFDVMRAALSGRSARRRLRLRGLDPTGGAVDAELETWPRGQDRAVWRWRALDDAAREGGAPGGGLGWCRVSAGGRIVDANAAFDAWLPTGGGGRPSFHAVAPEAARRLFADRLSIAASRSARDLAKPIALTARLHGGPDAPDRVAMLIAPTADGDAVVVAAPTARDARHEPELSADAEVVAALDGVEIGRLLEDAPVGVVALSADGRILRLNLAADRLLTNGAEGAPKAGPLGDHLVDWIAEEDRAQVAERLAAAARGLAGDAPNFEARLAASPSIDGRAAQCHFRRVDTARGRLLVGYLIDASEQRELKRSFIQSQRLQAVGDLTSGIAHDFNNILAAILGSCELLLENTTADEPAHEDLHAIRRNGEVAAKLVRNLLAFSRRQTLEPALANLNNEVNDTLGMMQRWLSEKIEIERRFAEDLWRVKIDVGQFYQVISNLVINARDAMPQGGRIMITTRNERVETARPHRDFVIPVGDYVRLDIRDSGCGIPPHIIDKIFQPFVTTKPVGKGTGLGLSTVYGIVKHSGGYISIESELGEGAQFSIFLPRATEAPPATVRQPTHRRPAPAPQEPKGAALVADMRRLIESAGAAPASHADRVDARAQASVETPAQDVAGRPGAPNAAESGRPVILLVEDEDTLRPIYRRYLASRGYEVIEATCGEDALIELEDPTRRIDLLLSDVVMPGMDGPAVVRALGDRRRDLPVIFMSGYPREAFADSMDGDPTGGRPYLLLAKPVEMRELAARVQEALAPPSV